jgi:hypothetical protein
MGYNEPRDARPLKTREDVGTERIIRISGSPLELKIYGTFGSQVAFALADEGRLSQAEISVLNARASTIPISGDVEYDYKYLFRALTGYFPPPDPNILAHHRTYNNIVRLANSMTSRRNTYLQWRYIVIPWPSIPKINIAIQSMTRQITDEPDISFDDKINLRGLLYLRALREVGRRMAGAPSAKVVIGNREVGPLSQANAKAYDALTAGPRERNFNVLLDNSDLAVFSLAQTVLNDFGVFEY